MPQVGRIARAVAEALAGLEAAHAAGTSSSASRAALPARATFAELGILSPSEEAAIARSAFEAIAAPCARALLEVERA